MMQLKTHTRQVELWVEQTLKDSPPDEVIDAFNKAFHRVWKRAELTLGQATMLAIADRVVHIGRENYPWLAPIHIHSNGIDIIALNQSADLPQDEPLRQGLSFLMAEFLRVLGNVTADIIVPKLHATLMEDPQSPVAKGGKQ